jgi:Undecaprenyl-phosphate galactose phosphotransferase WbaP
MPELSPGPSAAPARAAARAPDPPAVLAADAPAPAGGGAPAGSASLSPIANPPRVRALRVAILAASDFVSLFAAGAVAYLAWARPVRDQPAELYLGLAPLLALFLAGYAQAGLYPGFGLGPVETLRRLSRVTGFGALVLAAITFAVKLPHLYSRVTFGIAILLALVAVPTGRWLVATAAGRWKSWHEPVVVIGDGARVEAAIRALRDFGRLGYRPFGVLRTGGGAAGGQVEGAPVLGGLDRAPEVARRGVRVAIVELERRSDRPTLDWLQQHFRHVITVREFDALPVEGVQVRNLGGVLGIEYTNNLLRRRNRTLKRAVDLGLGSLALALAAPVVAAAALAVKLASRGPAFFAQERAGLDGRPIRVWKVRTMHADAERRLAEHLAARRELQREWERSFKLRDDPRLIPLWGPLLRRFSLDELPQLWSVVRGEMSLVGPRPFPPYHLARFPEEFRRLRQRVRPGLTGLWQVTVRGAGTIGEQQAHDTYYIRNWSLWLDLYLLGRTLGAVVGGRGAF